MLIVAFMIVGPFTHQVLGYRNPLFRPWTMFSGVGLHLADVRFSRRLPDGELIPLDHYQLLGYPDWRKAPLRLRNLQGTEAVRAVARELCAALGPGADVRVTARIATRTGWFTELMDVDDNHCGQQPDQQ